MRLLEGGGVTDLERIKEDEIRRVSLFDQSAAGKFEMGGGKSGHLAYCFFERDRLPLAHVKAEDPRVVAVGARVGGVLSKDGKCAVRSDGNLGVLEDRSDIVLGHQVID